MVEGGFSPGRHDNERLPLEALGPHPHLEGAGGVVEFDEGGGVVVPLQYSASPSNYAMIICRYSQPAKLFV